MKNIVIKKWIEPYKLLESLKENTKYSDYTFTGVNKEEKKAEFLKTLASDKSNIGLYMKNVNKYYIFTLQNKNTDTWTNLCNEFQISDNDIEISEDTEKPFYLIDIGKAEAFLILQ